MNWKHGYYADSGYTYGYYPETMPLRLHWAALVQNHEVPIQKFRYVDAGCGQGFNLIQAAIAHPDGEFVGIDFLPEHIAHARGLAERCGLTNIEFIEGDFIELAKNPQNLGLFDYAVCHGISTWISPVVKSGLFSLIGQILKPGGLFYNSYNTFPGWLGVVPFQHLVLLEQRRNIGTLALEAARKKYSSAQGALSENVQCLAWSSGQIELSGESGPGIFGTGVQQPLLAARVCDSNDGRHGGSQVELSRDCNDSRILQCSIAN